MICGGLAFAGMFAFITRSSFVYIEYFKMPVHYFPLFFGGNVVFMISSNFVNSILVKYYPPFTILKIGASMIVLVSLVMVFSVFFLQPSVYYFFVLMILFSSCLGFISGNALATALFFFKETSGTANALNGVIEYSMGGVTGVLIGLIGGNDLRSLVLVMLGCILLSWVAILPLFKYKSAEQYSNKLAIS